MKILRPYDRISINRDRQIADAKEAVIELADAGYTMPVQAQNIKVQGRGGMAMFLAGIAGISLIVAGVLIMNVMLVAVSQRTAEVGLMKALGARQRQILALFLTEAVLLSLVGAALGVAVGEAASATLSALFPVLTFAASSTTLSFGSPAPMRALARSNANIALAVPGFADKGEDPGLIHFACARAGRKTAHREEHFGAIGRGATRIESLRVAVEMMTEML